MLMYTHQSAMSMTKIKEIIIDSSRKADDHKTKSCMSRNMAF